jgi:ATP-dependent helicase HepA
METHVDVGSEVQDVRHRNRKGKVVAPVLVMAGRKMAKVQWDDNTIQLIPVLHLERYEDARDIWSLLRSRAFGGVEDFTRNFTHRKLLNPVDDTLYTLNASRTKLLPHQFKPLIKFLESIHRRYLIADEVGLGKTIEAGIILSELRARGTLGSVMIFCPNHLREKWQSELSLRFDERFRIVESRRNWARLLDEMEEHGGSDHRIIVGHKTLASKTVLDRISSGAPGFDLLIVDEAHHFKNSDTTGRQVLGEIADSSNQLLLLTATPLQTRSENLLSLLRLLDYREFQHKALFDDRLEANRRIVQAERLLRTSGIAPDDLRRAAEGALAELNAIPHGQRKRFGLEEADRLETITREVEKCRVEPSLPRVSTIARKIQELNLLSPYITRTRKVEVQQTCKRHVESVRPRDLRPEEEAFYRITVDWFRAEVEARHGEQSVLFLSRTFERRLSSSLHGFAEYLLKSGRPHSESILSAPPRRVLEAARALGEQDTKFDTLREMLSHLRKQHPGEKVILFASYRATLTYLNRRLAVEGWDHEVIHGGVPMAPGDREKDIRGQRVRQFLTDPTCGLLLSSNVGGEGLDLQRASIVVNYDLPWNPATLEQRIGRVDRFGQQAQLIRVLNFVLPGTVEDVIVRRIYERLHLFESAIGDFAEILGRAMQQLSKSFLRTRLTDEEMEEQACEAARRLERMRENLDALLQREREMVAYDQDFTDQLRELDRRAQSIRPADLQRLVDGVLQKRYPRSWIRVSGEARGEDGVFDFFMDSDLKGRLQAALGTRNSSGIFQFLRVGNERGIIPVTFDGEVAERHGDVILLTSRHPVLQLLVRTEGSAAEFHSVSAVRVLRAARSPGLLALLDARFSFGPQQRRYLMPIWTTAEETLDSRGSREILRDVLDGARNCPGQHAPAGEILVALLERARDSAQSELFELMSRIVAQEENRIRPRVAEARERYDRRIFRAEARLAERVLEDDGREESAKKIRSSREYLRRLKREKEDQIELISRLPEPELELEVVGATWVEFGR